MGLPLPNLDNRTFEKLLDEAMKSIPNYASQWTNHNPADPGITLIELLAWMAEITSYRINLVAEEHLLKYLKLLGIRPQGFLAATVDLSFEAEEIRYLEKGTVFLAEKTDERIYFELLEDITVIPAQLEKIIVDEKSVSLSPASSNLSQFRKLSRGIFDRSIANSKEDLFFAPFGLETRENSELYLGFMLKSQKKGKENCENLQGPESLNFMCYLYERDLIEPGKHGEESEYKFENATLKWEITESSEREQWREVFPEDRTQNFTKSGSFLFTGLEGWVCSSISAWPSQEKEEKYYWLRCTLLESEYEYPPRIKEIILNTATVVQKKKVVDITLGKSSGLPEQVFKLPEAPVLRESLKLILAGKEWNEVDDFDGSKPDSTHFALDSVRGEIRFGDGLRGQVPREGTEVQVTKYETSRGEQGNLPSDSVWTAKEEMLKGLKISNFKPATGGKNEEGVTEAFERFKRDLKVPYRTVTTEDFEYIASKTPGLRIAQAKAIPNFDPYNQADREGSVTVVIIPFSPLDTFKAPPRPSRGLINAVARHLEKHRLLGTRLYVFSPEYVQVEATVILGISEGSYEGKIRNMVLDKLNLYLHPTKGGLDGKGWNVGKPVYRSELYKLIMGIEGVEFVKKINIYAQKGAKQDENGDLILNSRIATVYSGEHFIEFIEKRR
jgi:hypothetical protein